MITINSQQLNISNRFYSPESGNAEWDRLSENSDDIADKMTKARGSKSPETITPTPAPKKEIAKKDDSPIFDGQTRPHNPKPIEVPSMESNDDETGLARYTDGDKIDQNPTTLLPFRYVPIPELPTQDEIEGNKAYNEALRRFQEENQDNPATEQSPTRVKGKGKVQPIYTPDSNDDGVINIGVVKKTWKELKNNHSGQEGGIVPTNRIFDVEVVNSDGTTTIVKKPEDQMLPEDEVFTDVVTPADPREPTDLSKDGEPSRTIDIDRINPNDYSIWDENQQPASPTYGQPLQPRSPLIHRHDRRPTARQPINSKPTTTDKAQAPAKPTYSSQNPIRPTDEPSYDLTDDGRTAQSPTRSSQGGSQVQSNNRDELGGFGSYGIDIPGESNQSSRLARPTSQSPSSGSRSPTGEPLTQEQRREIEEREQAEINRIAREKAVELAKRKEINRAIRDIQRVKIEADNLAKEIGKINTSTKEGQQELEKLVQQLEAQTAELAKSQDTTKALLENEGLSAELEAQLKDIVALQEKTKGELTQLGEDQNALATRIKDEEAKALEAQQKAKALEKRAVEDRLKAEHNLGRGNLGEHANATKNAQSAQKELEDLGRLVEKLKEERENNHKEGKRQEEEGERIDKKIGELEEKIKEIEDELENGAKRREAEIEGNKRVQQIIFNTIIAGGVTVVSGSVAQTFGINPAEVPGIIVRNITDTGSKIMRNNTSAVSLTQTVEGGTNSLEAIRQQAGNQASQLQALRQEGVIQQLNKAKEVLNNAHIKSLAGWAGVGGSSLALALILGSLLASKRSGSRAFEAGYDEEIQRRIKELISYNTYRGGEMEGKVNYRRMTTQTMEMLISYIKHDTLEGQKLSQQIKDQSNRIASYLEAMESDSLTREEMEKAILRLTKLVNSIGKAINPNRTLEYTALVTSAITLAASGNLSWTSGNTIVALEKSLMTLKNSPEVVKLIQGDKAFEQQITDLATQISQATGISVDLAKNKIMDELARGGNQVSTKFINEIKAIGLPQNIPTQIASIMALMAGLLVVSKLKKLGKNIQIAPVIKDIRYVPKYDRQGVYKPVGKNQPFQEPESNSDFAKALRTLQKGLEDATTGALELLNSETREPVPQTQLPITQPKAGIGALRDQTGETPQSPDDLTTGDGSGDGKPPTPPKRTKPDGPEGENPENPMNDRLKVSEVLGSGGLLMNTADALSNTNITAEELAIGISDDVKYAITTPGELEKLISFIEANNIPIGQCDDTITIFGKKLPEIEPKYTSANILEAITRIIEAKYHIMTAHAGIARYTDVLDFFIMVKPAIDQLSRLLYPQDSIAQAQFNNQLSKDILTQISIDRQPITSDRTVSSSLFEILNDRSHRANIFMTSFVAGIHSGLGSNVRHIIENIKELLTQEQLMELWTQLGDLNVPKTSVGIISKIIEISILQQAKIAERVTGELKLLNNVEHLAQAGIIGAVADYIIDNVPSFISWLQQQKDDLDRGVYDDIDKLFGNPTLQDQLDDARRDNQGQSPGMNQAELDRLIAMESQAQKLMDTIDLDDFDLEDFVGTLDMMDIEELKSLEEHLLANKGNGQYFGVTRSYLKQLISQAYTRKTPRGTISKIFGKEGMFNLFRSPDNSGIILARTLNTGEFAKEISDIFKYPAIRLEELLADPVIGTYLKEYTDEIKRLIQAELTKRRTQQYNPELTLAKDLTQVGEDITKTEIQTLIEEMDRMNDEDFAGKLDIMTAEELKQIQALLSIHQRGDKQIEKLQKLIQKAIFDKTPKGILTKIISAEGVFETTTNESGRITGISFNPKVFADEITNPLLHPTDKLKAILDNPTPGGGVGAYGRFVKEMKRLIQDELTERSRIQQIDDSGDDNDDGGTPTPPTPDRPTPPDGNDGNSGDSALTGDGSNGGGSGNNGNNITDQLPGDDGDEQRRDRMVSEAIAELTGQDCPQTAEALNNPNITGKELAIAISNDLDTMVTNQTSPHHLDTQIQNNNIPNNGSIVTILGKTFNLPPNKEPDYTNSTASEITHRLMQTAKHIMDDHIDDASPNEVGDWVLMAEGALLKLSKLLHPNNTGKQLEFETAFRREMLTKLATDRHSNDPKNNLMSIIGEITSCSDALFTTFWADGDLSYLLEQIKNLSQDSLSELWLEYDKNSNQNTDNTIALIKAILKKAKEFPDQYIIDKIRNNKRNKVGHIQDFVDHIDKTMIDRISEYKQWLEKQITKLENGDYNDLSVPFEMIIPEDERENRNIS